MNSRRHLPAVAFLLSMAVYAIFHHHGTGFNNEGKAIIPYITAATTTASMAYKNIWNISIFPVACSAVMYILPTEIA